jgi:hypothetical protein
MHELNLTVTFLRKTEGLGTYIQTCCNSYPRVCVHIIQQYIEKRSRTHKPKAKLLSPRQNGQLVDYLPLEYINSLKLMEELVRFKP